MDENSRPLKSNESMDCLIPGLPHDLSLLCLSRVSILDHASCKAVKRSWKWIFQSDHLLELRKIHSVQENFLFSIHGDPSVNPGMFFSTTEKKWRGIPPVPSEAHFYGLSSFRVILWRHFLFIIGGVSYDARAYPPDYPVPSARVYRYDIVNNQWSRLEDMHTARGSFACEIIGNYIYVAGGGTRHSLFFRGGSWFFSAEMYDIQKNKWFAIRDLNYARANCVGVYIENKFVVMGGYSLERFAGQVFHHDEYHSDVEEYCPESDSWIVKTPWRNENLYYLNCVAYFNDEILAVKDEEVWSYDKKDEVWIQESRFHTPYRIHSLFEFENDLIVFVNRTNRFGFQSYKGYYWNEVEGKLMKHYIFCSRAFLSPLNDSTIVSDPVLAAMKV